jgi:hypothetical protein
LYGNSDKHQFSTLQADTLNEYVPPYSTSTAFPLLVGFAIETVNLNKAHHKYAHSTAEHCSAEKNEQAHY